jgi:AcrR family transcriptional regulator
MTTDKDAMTDKPAAIKVSMNKKGQSLGSKGDRSRQRIMDAAFELLKIKNIWDISVTDICSQCDIAASNLYTYFKGVEEVVLSLAEQIVDHAPPLVALVEGSSWKGRSALLSARNFVDAEFVYWERYRSVLKVVELLGDEGNVNFNALRARRLIPIYQALRPVVERAQAEGRIHKKMDAAILVVSALGVIEAAAMHVPQILQFGYNYERLSETHSRLLVQHLTGWTA